MKNKIKILFIIIFIIILIVAIVIANKKSKSMLEEYAQINYEYFALYSTENKVGVVNKDGKKILDTEYTDVFIPNPSKDVFFAYVNSTDYKILNSNGEELFKNFDCVETLQTSELSLDFEKNFLRFKKNDKYGLIDYDGNIVLSADYDDIKSLKYRPGEILIEKDGKVGVVGFDGNIKIDVKYDSIVGDEYYTETYGYTKTGYIVGEKGNSGYLYGYINNLGNKILDVQYEAISRVLKYNDENNLYFIVMNNGKKGVYKNSKEIIEQKYQNINYTESSDIFVAKRNAKYGIFSTEGKEILAVKYAGYSLAGDYISVQNDNGEKELYDVNGNKVSNLNYKSIQASGNSECYIAIDDNGYYSIITRGDTISDNYIYISYAFDNYFIFKNETGNYGLLNIYSGVAIEPTYTFMLTISGTNAIEAQSTDGNVDIFSKKLEKIATISGAIVEKVDSKYTSIYSNSNMIYINNNGEIVENTEVYPDHKIYAYSENGKWGYKDKSGNVVIECQYDFAADVDIYGYAGILLNGEWGIVNSKGEIIKNPAFKIDTYYLPMFVGEYLLELSDEYHCLELE